jgi:hypothetical protein
VFRSALPFELPAGVDYSLLTHVCDVLNDYGNSKFPHSSARFPGKLPIKFGSIV